MNVKAGVYAATCRLEIVQRVCGIWQMDKKNEKRTSPS